MKASNSTKPKNGIVVRPAIIRFESFFTKGGQNECWNWRGGRLRTGYGSFGAGTGRKNHKTVTAHRFSYQAYRGHIEAGLYICHTCDNKLCVNPNHLFKGTQRDNMLDARSKGLIHDSRGEKHWKSKLTANQVSEIRELYVYRKFGCNRLAAIYKVTHQAIWAIVRRKLWRKP